MEQEGIKMLALRELLHNLKDRNWDVNPIYSIDENEADKIIKQLERLDNYSNWNLTKNKLPKEEEYVLCVLETGKQAVMMLVKDEEDICFWSEDFPQDSYFTDQVIFWKPLDRVCGVDTYDTEEFEKLKKQSLVGYVRTRAGSMDAVTRAVCSRNKCREEGRK